MMMAVLIEDGLFAPIGNMESGLTNVREFEELARQALPKMFYDFFRGGAEDEFTLRENVEAFQRIWLRFILQSLQLVIARFFFQSLAIVLRLNPRVLIDVSSINTSTSLLGFKLSAPILVAPTGGHKLAHPEGEVATARAAAACNTIMVLSFSSNCTVEEVATSCNAVRFFQLYIYKRRDVSAKIVQRAENCGFKAIVLTVDTPRIGRREADIKNKMIALKVPNLEGLLSVDVNADGGSNLEAYANETLDPSLSWKDLAWLKSITKLPILIKGVLTAEDARKAVEVGVSGIIVSNHGGRQLDYVPASISALEEVVQAVSGAIPVLVDGGIRRGTDVFKAVALGAKAVMVGRPIIFGLAAKGELGVRNVIGMLKNELENTMALAGCPSVEDISRSHVRTPADWLRSSI